ncbi:hypothetical protein ACQEV2_27795 [Streptomyces sp. CA-251387]|uniref:hypothetical protein n=1 Tax=Streptomyces sp. CA-251387 TaxID=3240064 RepID=UPI003D92256B
MYVVVEQSPAMSGDRHDRMLPGLHHLAFHAGSRDQVDTLAEAAPAHGRQLLLADRYPYAGLRPLRGLSRQLGRLRGRSGRRRHAVMLARAQ